MHVGLHRNNDSITETELSTNWPTFTDLYLAYGTCRLRKQPSPEQIRFEMRLGENLLKLERKIQSRSYRPGRSSYFVVTTPKPREVFAAAFTDRVVHHLLVAQLEPGWERRFSHSNFACRNGRGTHGALGYFQKLCKKISAGSQKDVWVLQLDISSFFATIDRAILKNLLLAKTNNPTLRFLIEAIYDHDPRPTAQYRGRPELRHAIDHKKSWFSRPPEQGIAIGNLTSQFGASVYLNGLDHFIQRELKIMSYIRYMDDLTLIDIDPANLSQLIEPIGKWLQDHRRQTLNPKKTVLSNLRNGIDYLGYRIRQTDSPKNPAQLFATPQARWKLVQAARLIERCGLPEPKFLHPLCLSKNTAARSLIFCSINSRLGMIKHARSYRLREKTLERLNRRFREPIDIPEEAININLFDPWDALRVAKDLNSITPK